MPAAIIERLVEIHSNPAILYYGFKGHSQKTFLLSVASQKGIISIQRCFGENEKVLSLNKANGNSALLVFKGASVNSVNTLLVLRRQYTCFCDTML